MRAYTKLLTVAVLGYVVPLIVAEIAFSDCGKCLITLSIAL